MTDSKYIFAVGRRKRATVYVKLKKGTGKILLNGNNLKEESFSDSPFNLAGESGKWDVEAKASGGGARAQIAALRLAISRALVKSDPKLRTTLKKAGYLSRDPREKERKKPGLKRARRAPQWSKR